MNEFRLDGKTALITGGGGDIGGETARAMAKVGAFVNVADIDLDHAKAVVASIEEAGGRARAHQVDISNVDSVAKMYDNIEDGGQNPLDIVVCGAGVIYYESLLKQTEQNLDHMIDVNIKGTFLCLQQAARRMAERHQGKIVLFASTAAFTSSRLPAVAYATTKGAIRQMTVAASVELAPLGVQVNAVAPGTIKTAFTKDSLDSPEKLEAAGARIPMGRVGEPDDVVGAIVFLCSPLAAYITGHTLVIDGGRLGRSG